MALDHLQQQLLSGKDSKTLSHSFLRTLEVSLAFAGLGAKTQAGKTKPVCGKQRCPAWGRPGPSTRPSRVTVGEPEVAKVRATEP